MTDTTELPEGYYIIDSEIDEHDGDSEDGRYGCYKGDPYENDDAEFLGNLHDKAEVIRLAHEHANQNKDPE